MSRHMLVRREEFVVMILKLLGMCFLDGMDGGGDGEVGEILYSPLCLYFPIAVGEFDHSGALQCAKDIYPIVGISCVGHEEQFLALLTVVEEEYCQDVLASLSKLGMKGSREIRNLECSINCVKLPLIQKV